MRRRDLPADGGNPAPKLRTAQAVAPIVAIGLGAAAAAGYGLYDFDLVKEAAWVGFPLSGWPGIVPEFGETFWTLLPVFLFLAVISVAKATRWPLRRRGSPGGKRGP